MKRMAERNITDDQVQWNIDHANLCISQFNGTRLVYYSDEGVTVLTKTGDYDGIDWQKQYGQNMILMNRREGLWR